MSQKEKYWLLQGLNTAENWHTNNMSQKLKQHGNFKCYSGLESSIRMHGSWEMKEELNNTTIDKEH